MNHNFFEKHGFGVAIERPDHPLDRFRGYEGLLEELRAANLDKFDRIHKGTPYYFLFANAYDCGFYDRALFYIDAAISEDIKHHGSEWSHTQAAGYLWLKKVEAVAGRRPIEHTRRLLEEQRTRFNAIAGKPIGADDFTNFLTQLLKDPSKRAIVTAFYTYLLESEERLKELRLRSSAGGSIELPLTFLFKGALVFESLLKTLYPNLKPAPWEEFSAMPLFKRIFQSA